MSRKHKRPVFTHKTSIKRKTIVFKNFRLSRIPRSGAFMWKWPKSWTWHRSLLHAFSTHDVFSYFYAFQNWIILHFKHRVIPFSQYCTHRGIFCILQLFQMRVISCHQLLSKIEYLGHDHWYRALPFFGNHTFRIVSLSSHIKQLPKEIVGLTPTQSTHIQFQVLSAILTRQLVALNKLSPCCEINVYQYL